MLTALLYVLLAIAIPVGFIWLLSIGWVAALVIIGVCALVYFLGKMFV